MGHFQNLAEGQAPKVILFFCFGLYQLGIRSLPIKSSNSLRSLDIWHLFEFVWFTCVFLRSSDFLNAVCFTFGFKLEKLDDLNGIKSFPNYVFLVLYKFWEHLGWISYGFFAQFFLKVRIDSLLKLTSSRTVHDYCLCRLKGLPLSHPGVSTRRSIHGPKCS